MNVTEQLPEITVLRGNVRSETERLFEEKVPEYFWTARAARSYHHPSERGAGGLLLHTKRAFFAWTVLEPTFRTMGGIDQMEAECARSAILLHDAFKYGPKGVEEDPDDDKHQYADGVLAHLPSSNASHDVQMAEIVRNESDLPDRVADCIETHGGSERWNTSHSGPKPYDDLTLAHHLSDLFASRQEYALPVYDVSEELERMIGESVPVVPIENVEDP